jgi:RNA polymerase sigma-70 factor (ECF subfamily)
VLLKDVFDYSLEEIAELVDSTVGGVKAALKRGRSKLAASPQHAVPARKKNQSETRLLRLYIERFNRRDWEGVRQLISADARLEVADRFLGPMSESPYFGNYERLTVKWRMALGEVDGEPVIVRLDREQDQWTPRSFIRLYIENGQIVGIVDYWHCPWVLPAAASIIVNQSLLN